VGQLTGGIAHDFNNLLTVVLGNIEMMEDDLAGDERMMHALGMVQRAALRGSELTHRLLAFSRQQMLEPSDIDMNAAISGLAGMVARTLGEHIDVRTVLAPDLWVTRIDPGQLESAVLNLCVNARDAMPNGGTLTVSTSNMTLAPDAARGDTQAGEYVVLSVSDTGTGIPPEILERVFEPFFTTKEQGKGTGLGLSMVYGFVSQSGGHLDITSTPHRGTTLKMIFPRSRTAPAVQPLTVVADLPGGTETILVVEDQLDVRSITVAMLESLGYHAVIASDAAEALDLLKGSTAVDLLFTDVVMPGSMSGVELAQQARLTRPGLKVLFCSGYRESALRNGGDTLPSDVWIAKPFRRHRLAERVRQALDQK
jgi:CheY-like chemotaxis protein